MFMSYCGNGDSDQIGIRSNLVCASRVDMLVPLKSRVEVLAVLNTQLVV